MAHLIQITRNVDSQGNTQYAKTKTFSFPYGNSLEIQISGLDSAYDSQTVTFETIKGRDLWSGEELTGSNVLSAFDGTGGTQNTGDLTQTSTVTDGVATFYISPGQTSNETYWLADTYYTFFLVWELSSTKQEQIKFETLVKAGQGGGVAIPAGDFTGKTNKIAVGNVAQDGLDFTAYTIPKTDGTTGQVLKTDGAGAVTWATDSASPDGADTQIQFNNSGSFGADSDLTYNTGTNTLSSSNIAGTITTATQGTIDHDSLTNFVANEHIDWTSTSSNLSTSGTITSTAAGSSITQEAWNTPSFENSWVNLGSGFETAGYFKDSNGIVWIKGIVASGTSGATIFTLPAGYRPANNLVNATVANGAFGVFNVNTDGTVNHSNGSTSWMNIAVAFRV